MTAYYGQDRQLQPFLDFHRRIGVSEFVFLDLSPQGSLADLLRGQADCAVWRARGRGRPAHALYWRNYLRWRYGSGRWCLSIEPSERFVYFRCESRQIKDLVEFLESEQRDHIYALIVEMYGDQPARTMYLDPGEDPARKLRYFDAFGYSTAESGDIGNVTVRGGPQRRTAYRTDPANSPALNRIPLIRWRWYFAYVAGRRLVMPQRLNEPHSQWHSNPTACLLRYALIDDGWSLELAARFEMAAMISDGNASAYAGLNELRGQMLKHDASVKYSASLNLVDAGLLNPGQWF